METTIEWTTGLLTALVIILMVRKWKYAPILGIVIQAFWFWYIALTHAWGLLVCTIVILGSYIYGTILWIKESKKCLGGK